jgi:hypothetical protein
MKIIGLLLRLGLSVVLLYAGAVKLLDTRAFAEDIGNYRLFPTLAPPLAVTLPPIEIATGLALAFGRGALRQGAALLGVGLLLVFTIAVASARLRGIDVRCGCFGTGGGPVTTLVVLRDIGFTLWAVLVLVLERRASDAQPLADA